jgi:uncharacterized low-complexity protein
LFLAATNVYNSKTCLNMETKTTLFVAGSLLAGLTTFTATATPLSLGTAGHVRAALLGSARVLPATLELQCGEATKKEAKTDAKAAEHKCGEGKCGETKTAASTDTKAAEHKCGEGKCGETKKAATTGAAKTDAKTETKAAEHKCGEGKCGQ